VLTDPRRTKHETRVFFTRHWGEGYTPRTTVPPVSSIVKVDADHFKHYLFTTAKVC
jgi:hypothetical protein